jgi:hypothetical protein
MRHVHDKQRVTNIMWQALRNRPCVTNVMWQAAVWAAQHQLQGVSIHCTGVWLCAEHPVHHLAMTGSQSSYRGTLMLQNPGQCWSRVVPPMEHIKAQFMRPDVVGQQSCSADDPDDVDSNHPPTQPTTLPRLSAVQDITCQCCL